MSAYESLFGSAVAAARTLGPGSTDTLVALLTVDALLVTAFALAATFTVRTPAGWDLLTSVTAFAWSVAGLIIVVGLGAITCWGDVYLRFGLTAIQYFAGAALLIGVLGISWMAVWIAAALGKNESDND